MNKESKETIKTVFDNFDKDKSNYIDIKEIGLVSKELGDPISEQDLQRIFIDLDINKDGRISFEEFWDWWTYGRSNKLERLVFLKLKALNLLKKAHAGFVRYGASLESKFDNNMDHHYIAINMGVPVPETSLTLRANVRGEEATAFQNLAKGLPVNKEFIGAVLRFETPDCEQAKVELERILGIIKEQGAQAVPELEMLLPFITFSTGIEGKSVVLGLEIRHPFFLDLVQKFQTGVLERFGPEFQIKLAAPIGLKNSFKKLMDNQEQKFIAFFFEGFLAEFELALNSGLLKTLRNAALGFLMQSKSVSNWGVLLSLIQGSKFHLVFREVDDVLKFFKGLGLEKLVQAQPSSKDIVDELKRDLGTPNKKQDPIFMGLVNFCQKHVLAHLNLGIRLPETVVSLQFDSTGVKEFVNYMLSD